MSPLSGIESGLVRRYADAARDALATDRPLAEARDAWAGLVRASHGDVFAPADIDRDGAFVDALTFDFLIDALLDVLEAATGATVANRDPRRNTDVLPVAFGPLHDRVLDPAAGRERVRAAVSQADLRSLTPGDLRALYGSVIDPDVRLALGEYYTPRAVADLAVGELDIDGDTTVLDPGCGTGAFLTACLDHKRGSLPADRGDRITAATETVFGLDINPVAVKSAKLAYGCALFDALTAVETVELPVFLADALGLAREGEIRFRGDPMDLTVDALAGNPPWVPWERLSARMKRRWREEYVDDLGLKPHDGAAARLGHSNDDVSVPYAWVCIHRYLREGGRASFVLKRDPMRGPAGAVLRRLKVGDRPLSLAGVHDLAALDPFPDAGANAAVYTFETDADPSFPVEATVWSVDETDRTPDYGSGERFRRTATATTTAVVPLDPADATTAWIRADAERAAVGECAHEIRHGLKDDANAVFGLDRPTLDRVDTDLAYPYLTSRHVRKWGVTGHDLRLVPQRTAGEDNEAWLRQEFPDTYEYLRAHRDELAARSSSWLDRDPFYSVFGLGEYTWAPYKVVWCRLGFKPDFAVVSTRSDPDLGERKVVPGDHYMFVATDSRETAHFLCALCNSAPYQRTLRDLSSNGKASLSKAVVSELELPPYPGTPTAERLVDLSVRAHDLVADGTGSDGTPAELDAVQAEIDERVESWLADLASADG